MRYKTVFFDLFFTLIKPDYIFSRNENDVLGITRNEWESYAEEESIYYERAAGKVKDETEIIDQMVSKIPYEVTKNEKKQILGLRKKRMHYALENVDSDILQTLQRLHNEGVKTCLVSNADIIDCKYYGKSPLKRLIDQAIFSCDIGVLKPDKLIYTTALQSMNAKPEESLFVGDGGSNELKGAKETGIHPVLSETLIQRSKKEKEKLLIDAEYQIMKFDELYNIVMR